MISAPADITKRLPALMMSVALSGMPFKVPPVAAPTCTLPVPARVTLPVKVFGRPRPRMVRPVPMKVTLPVPEIALKSVRSAAFASRSTSRASVIPLKPMTPVPVTLAEEPRVTVPVPLAETRIGAVR